MRAALAALAHAFLAVVVGGQHSTADAASKIELNSPAAGQVDRVDVTMDVSGSLLIAEGEKTTKVPLKVNARFRYDERLIKADGGNRKTIRYYHDAKASLAVSNTKFQPALGQDHRWIVTDIAGPTATLFSPHGPLTRDELDLIAIPGNSAALAGILPSQSLAVGDTWKVPDASLAPLVGVDSVGTSDVQCELTAVEQGTAQVTLAGHVDGAVNGAATEIQVKGSYTLDAGSGRFSKLSLELTDKRSAGLVGPALEVVCKIELTTRPLGESKQLASETLEPVAKHIADPPQTALRLRYNSSQHHYSMDYDRLWHVTSDEGNTLVLRRVEEGEMVAQCNVSPLKRVAAGKHLSMDAFKDSVLKAGGEKTREIVSTLNGKTPRGMRRYRLVVTGESKKVPVRWHYYLLGDEQGRQVAVVFTMHQKQAERLGDADEVLVNSLEFSGK